MDEVDGARGIKIKMPCALRTCDLCVVGDDVRWLVRPE